MTTTEAGWHLSPELLAEREGVPVATVYQWRSRGTGPPGFRVGRHVRFRLVDVIAWEERQLAADRSGAA
ncbi:MAG: helix-turn-helix domain-containing protein [Acidimicrobiales bacterium]